MSRDLTPKDSHILDKHYHFANEPLVLTNIETGVEVKIYDPSCELALRWPNAYYLATEIVEKLKGAPTTLTLFEELLRRIIKLSDDNKPLVFPDDQLATTIAKWYEGKLDPNFYYSTHNNELLYEALRKVNVNF